MGGVLVMRFTRVPPFWPGGPIARKGELGFSATFFVLPPLRPDALGFGFIEVMRREGVGCYLLGVRAGSDTMEVMRGGRCLVLSVRVGPETWF
jgi:hypothetical protein